MRALGLATMVTLLPALLRGQQQTVFDTVHFNQVGSFAIGNSVFETENGYLCFGLQKGPADMSQDIYTSRFDTEGGLIDEMAIETYRQDNLGQSSPVAKGQHGYYCGWAIFGINSAIDSLFVLHFDEQGDTLWSRFIAADTAWVIRGTAVELDGDILLCGLHYPDSLNGSNAAYVYHLDSLGSVKGYQGYVGFDGEDVAVGADGSWYVGGLDNVNPNYGHVVVLRSDTNGNQLWRRTDPNEGLCRSLIATRDSGVVVLGSDLPDPDTGGFALVYKYNLSGVLQWRKEYFQAVNSVWPSQFTVGFEQEDRSLILGGWYRGIAERDRGVLVKLDEFGELVWRRLYTHYPGAAYGKDQIFWDVKPTSDGGLVLTGETNSDDYPYAQLWLLKLDSAGCLVPGCGSVGVEEFVDDLNKYLRVSPNPASEKVNIALDLPEGSLLEGVAQVMLLDATSKLIAKQPLQQNLNQLRATVDVSALPKGLYYIHLRDGKRWLAGSKVVVQ